MFYMQLKVCNKKHFPLTYLEIDSHTDSKGKFSILSSGISFYKTCYLITRFCSICTVTATKTVYSRSTQ